MSQAIIWLIVAAVAIIVDLATSNFIFMWFSLSALVSLVLSLVGVSMPVQIVTFLVVGIIIVSIGYPWAKKKFKVTQNKIPTMEQTYIGRVMVAENHMGETSKIKVGGIYWTAFNKGVEIEKGQKFIITGIEGNKLTVKLEEE